MLFDIGGSMDDHIEQVQQLFSAAHGEFKQLEFFYFHNCVYEHVWKSAKRRTQDMVPLESLILERSICALQHRFGAWSRQVLKIHACCFCAIPLIVL